MTRPAKLAIAAAALCAAIAPAADAAKPTPTGSTAPAQVFFPNPVQSLRDETLTDQKDANYPALAAAYERKTLTDLDGSGTLTGAYARVESETGKPARNTGSGFIYTRDQDQFEQVMGYYWVTQAQLYIQSLGFGSTRPAVNKRQQLLRINQYGGDNSFYRNGTKKLTITLGKGGVDDAEDAEVIVHEYGHSVQDDQVPGFGSTLEAGSIGEAFGDYLAVTVTSAVTRETSFHEPCVADWDSVSYTAGPVALPAPGRRHQALSRGRRGRGARRRRDVVGGAVAGAWAHRQHDPHGQGDHRRAVRIPAEHLVPSRRGADDREPPGATESRVSSSRRSPSAASSIRSPGWGRRGAAAPAGSASDAPAPGSPPWRSSTERRSGRRTLTSAASQRLRSSGSDPTGRYGGDVAGPDARMLELAGREVRITSPDKVFFRERGETKLDLVRYYAAVAEPLMRAMGGRPVLMQRFPQGAGGPSFFQKRVPDNAPEWLETTTVETVNGTPSRALVAADVAHVAWAVNLACLGFHVWPFRAADPEHADELRLDLDPQPGTRFAEARAAAWELKALLDELGLVGFPKTTGNRGLHVYVRLAPHWDAYAVRAAAVAAARELERRRPDILTAAWWKEERGRRIFVDYNQNAPHKTVFGAWSVRSRSGAQVSTPIRWEELDDIEPDDLTLMSVPERLERDGDPWAAIDDAPQSLEPLLALHERDRANGLHDAPWPPVYPKQPDEPPRVAPSRARREG